MGLFTRILLISCWKNKISTSKKGLSSILNLVLSLSIVFTLEIQYPQEDQEYYE